MFDPLLDMAASQPTRPLGGALGPPVTTNGPFGLVTPGARLYGKATRLLMPLVVSSREISRVPKKPFMNVLNALSAALTCFAVALDSLAVALTCCCVVVTCCWVLAWSSFICLSC